MTTTQTQGETTIYRILSHEGITRVICIDDFYVDGPAIEDILGAAMSCNVGALQGIMLERNQVLTIDDQDIMRAEIESYVQELDGASCADLYHKITMALQDGATLSAEDESVVERAATELNGLMVGIDFQTMAPSIWMSSRDELLRDSKSGKVLLIFDEELGDGLSGLELIKSILAEDVNNNRFVCCLLSHTIKRPDDEPEAWEQLAKKHDLDKSKFFPISKKRVSDVDIDGFSLAVKRTVLNAQLQRLRDKASSIIADADKEALSKIEKMDLFDIERAVFLSSEKEGVSELETFFRLFGLFHRLEARKNAIGNGDIQTLINHVRSVNTIVRTPTSEPNAKLWEIMNIESFEDSDAVNSNHLPVDLGDIFEIEPNGLRLMLLTQSCDLMIRPTAEGKRNRYVREAKLIEFRKGGPNSNSDGEVLLKYYGSHGENWTLCLKRSHTVLLSVLDLCVFHCDGHARISLDDTCQDGVIFPWQLRHEVLKKEWGQAYCKVETLAGAGINQAEAAQLILRTSMDCLLAGAVDTASKTISFPCKRIGRLRRPRSEAMLARYVAFLARAGFAHDLDRELE